MRYLRKDDGTVYVWTEALAKRDDMTEVTTAQAKLGKPSKPTPKSDPEPTKESGDESGESEAEDVDAIDPLAITDKAELKRLILEHGGKVTGNPSLTTLQAKLAEVLKG